MKIARLLLLVALFGLSCSIARADGTDPKVLTSGCGGQGEPACDTYFLTTGNPTTVTGISFVFNSAGTMASISIGDWTGADVGRFILNLASTDSNGDSLNYTCDDTTPPPLGAFSCTQLTADSFEFDALPGSTLCSLPLPDNQTDAGLAASYISGAAVSPCQWGEIFTLEVTEGDPNLSNATVAASAFAPEPPSGLLLLMGLAAGAFVLRKYSSSLA